MSRSHGKKSVNGAISSKYGYGYSGFMRDQYDPFGYFHNYQHQREKEKMTETKRKTKTSTAVKQRYNEKVYDNISVRIPKELAAAFKEKCVAENVSQAQIIKKAIESFLAQ